MILAHEEFAAAVDEVPYNWKEYRDTWTVAAKQWEETKSRACCCSSVNRKLSGYGAHKTKQVQKGETKMYQKIKEEIVSWGLIVIIGVGAYALANVGAWASYAHGREVQAARTTVERAEASIAKAEGQVKGMAAGIQAMSKELIKVNNDETTKIVVKYMQGGK